MNGTVYSCSISQSRQPDKYPVISFAATPKGRLIQSVLFLNEVLLDAELLL